MRKNASRLALLAATAAALVAGCATQVGTADGWNIPSSGSTWQIEQRNTGSYGKDVTNKVTRGDSVWKGQQVVTLANSNGFTVLALPDGRWTAMLGRDGKLFMTFDPPIGYLYPLSVGKSWNTKHKVTMASGAVTDLTYSCKVADREKVSVPAGTFDTFKIVCDSPTTHDVSWTIPELGMHAKQQFERLPGHPQGAGTQRSQLIVVNRGS